MTDSDDVVDDDVGQVDGGVGGEDEEVHSLSPCHGDHCGSSAWTLCGKYF